VNVEIAADRLAHAVGAQHVASDGPRVIVRPGAPAEIADIVRIAGELGAVVGVGVTAGIDLDLARMCNVLHLDETSLLCAVQVGITVEKLEGILSERGLMLGPLPATSRTRTLGALLAAPRPSEASPRPGRFTNACAGVAAILPDGIEISTRIAPRKASGPDLMHALVGARGTLGLITSATLRVQRRHDTRLDAAWRLPSLAAALETARTLLVRGARPLDLAVTAAGVLQLSLDGSPRMVEAEAALAGALAREHGGEPVRHAPPPRAQLLPYEKAVALEEIDKQLLAPSLLGEALRIVGWHVGGATVMDLGRPPLPPPPPSPLLIALKQRLDPDGRFPQWPADPTRARLELASDA
jgi:FAD/FMN-containing dehydrogenase